MKFLGVDTSSPAFSVVLWEGPQILSSRTMASPERPSLLLTHLIQQVLEEGHLNLTEVDAFVLSIGPGSFTGLRVGVTTIKTLAWAASKPVLPVSSLQVLAENLVPTDRPVCPFVDARKGKVYTASFLPEPQGTLKRAGPDELLVPEEALKRLPPQAWLVGDGIKKYGELVSRLETQGIAPAAERFWVPTPEGLMRVASSQWPQGRVDDPHPLVPQYLYSKESDITGW